MNEFELKFLDLIQDTFSCGFFDAFMPFVTKFADHGIGWIILSVILIFIPKTRKSGVSMGVALILGLLIGNVILKNAVARIRPFDLNPEIQLLIDRLSDFSFPSGHTLASFEGAVVLMIRDKRLGIPALVLAIIIALSRLYLYVHYPTDVLAGALLGTAIAFFACFIIDKLWTKYKLNKYL